jgi:hypothetical protein
VRTKEYSATILGRTDHHGGRHLAATVDRHALHDLTAYRRRGERDGG